MLHLFALPLDLARQFPRVGFWVVFLAIVGCHLLRGYSRDRAWRVACVLMERGLRDAQRRP
jgi:hypothetical protein